MTIYEYVARQFNVDDGTGAVVGANPLDTLDGDASYVTSTWSGASLTTVTTFRLEPVGPPAPAQSTWTGLRARMAWKRTSGIGGIGDIYHRYMDGGSSQFVGTGDWGQGFNGIPDEATADGYLAQWAVLDPQFSWPDLLGATSWQVFRPTGQFGSPATDFRCTYLRVFIEAPGTRKLRQFHRDDGHGMTPPRAFGGASRIRTGRAYGYD